MILTLLWLPFGKFFHIFQRPAQLGVAFYKDAGRARRAGAAASAATRPFASAQMVRDLITVERELGFRYEIDAGGAHALPGGLPGAAGARCSGSPRAALVEPTSARG